MKKLFMTVALLAVIASPVLANEPAAPATDATVTTTTTTTTEAPAADATHMDEAHTGEAAPDVEPMTPEAAK